MHSARLALSKSPGSTANHYVPVGRQSACRRSPRFAVRDAAAQFKRRRQTADSLPNWCSAVPATAAVSRLRCITMRLGDYAKYHVKRKSVVNEGGVCPLRSREQAEWRLRRFIDILRCAASRDLRLPQVTRQDQTPRAKRHHAPSRMVSTSSRSTSMT